jgi:hypothetical protein
MIPSRDQFQPMPNGAPLQLGTEHCSNRMGYSRIRTTEKLTAFFVLSVLYDVDDDWNADLDGALKDADGTFTKRFFDDTELDDDLAVEEEDAVAFNGENGGGGSCRRRFFKDASGETVGDTEGFFKERDGETEGDVVSQFNVTIGDSKEEIDS